ncbi:hypothetical protein GCM10028818_54940 [Spirosoma horti]
MEQFINLDRLFNQLPIEYTYASKNDDIDLTEFNRFQKGGSLGWQELLKERRVVIIAEAGAGKTQEICHATQTLRRENKYAFFMRLEHIADDLESAFEIGTFQEFQDWLNSNEEGWLLLDSVDEARLKDPKDFERAVRKLASRVSIAIPRAHFIITSRITAWRPKTDLTFCNARLPDLLPAIKEDKNDTSDDIFTKETSSLQPEYQPIYTNNQKETGFKVYTLTDLTSDQISVFVTKKSVENSTEFLRELERRDAWAFTTRPQDLEELLEFWSDTHRIGTRFELMEHSVKRRLEERDQDRADSRPFTVEKAQKGARLLASASVLMHGSVFQVPDGITNSKGIDVKSILTDWDDEEIQILLSRPLFDEAIYGTVRFHHRSVREYLAAVWFAEELQKAGSRQKIERLFFRTQYEQLVIIPSMRPVLSWLVLFDSELLLKVYSLEPELILEGGDPSRVPIELRRKILTSVCQKLDSTSFYRSFEERVAIQRFASPDLVSDIINLLEAYRHNTNVTTYLLNLIWQGQMKAALPTALSFALDHTKGEHTRIAAIRVVKEIGTRADLDAVCVYFLSEESSNKRRILAELVDSLEPSQESIAWLLKALKNTPDDNRYDSDHLGYSLLNFINRADLDAVSSLVEGIDPLLHFQPVIEQRYCEISNQYGWLLNLNIRAIEKLIINKHPAVFASASLFALTQIPTFYQFGDHLSWSPDHKLPILIAEWPNLNHALFWKHVEETRNHYEKHEKEPLTSFWQVSVFEGYWKFSANDFQSIVTDVSRRSRLDDRLIALSQAFHLYKENGSPSHWLDALEKAVVNEVDLVRQLDGFLNPPPPSKELKEFWDKGEQRRQKREEHEKKRQQDHADYIKWLNDNVEILRSNGLEKGNISQDQYALYQRMVRIGRTNKVEETGRNWQGLIEEFGIEVATALRDALLNFWRTYTPIIRSEDNTDTVSKKVEFGLSGLEIESSEMIDWPKNLSEEEAEIACRYAFREWGNFPNWFPKLHKQYPHLIRQLVVHEIGWELAVENPQEAKHYILSKVSWSCEWLWDSIAETILEILEKEPANVENLKYLLRIIQGSAIVSSTDLAQLAERKCNTLTSSQTISYWYATWLSTEPERAIRSFSDCLAALYIKDQQEAINMAMQTIVALLGGRRSGSGVRETFKSPMSLMKLYHLMHQYIRVEEDIERANTGVYSPGLRDEAQDARNNLYSMLKTIPGKEAYLAMIELARMHPAESYRSWMKQNATERAEKDADSLPWTAKQFNDFANTLECTPNNHRELFELGVQRLIDLKHSLEESDDSIASTLVKENEEIGIRKVIANWCRSRSTGKYLITQEEELADAKRPDCRFHSSLFDAPVPVELKLADNWSGPDLFERLENQLCGDYLRDNQSNSGIFVLVYRGQKTSWQLLVGKPEATFPELIDSLQDHWVTISANYPKINQIIIIGIDLTKRINRVKSLKKKPNTKQKKTL